MHLETDAVWFKRMTAMRLTPVASWTGRDCWGADRGRVVQERKGRDRHELKENLQVRDTPDRARQAIHNGTDARVHLHALPILKSIVTMPSPAAQTQEPGRGTRPLRLTTRPVGLTRRVVHVEQQRHSLGTTRGGCSAPSAAGTSLKGALRGRIEIWDQNGTPE